MAADKGAYHGMGVEILMFGKTGKHETLLNTKTLREAVIVADRPAVSVYLMRLDTWQQMSVHSNGGRGIHTNRLSELLHFRISLDDQLALRQLLDRDLRLSAFRQLVQSLDLPLAILEGDDDVVRFSV